jgi:hypothetical protein
VWVRDDENYHTHTLPAISGVFLRDPVARIIDLGMKDRNQSN